MPPHGPDILFSESNCLAVAPNEQNLCITIGYRNIHQLVVAAQVDGNDAAGAWTRKLAERRLLDRTAGGTHEYKMPLRVLFDRQYRIDALFFVERQEIHNRLATRAPAGLRNLVNL